MAGSSNDLSGLYGLELHGPPKALPGTPPWEVHGVLGDSVILSDEKGKLHVVRAGAFKTALAKLILEDPDDDDDD